jgi:hypothetical protein
MKDATVIPTFLWRLYNPGPLGQMYGQDDTLLIPSAKAKEQMYAALCKIPFYKTTTLSEATEDSLWIKAARSHIDDRGVRVSEVVTCFTIGAPIWSSDELFGCATLVNRVLLKEDVMLQEGVEAKAPPTIYALKDTWRQTCRRPEADFYDVIARHCEENDVDATGMARCHGSIDLSVATGLGHNPSFHKTCSAKTFEFERCHMRLLLTPVGSPLKAFTSTRALAEALYSTVRRASSHSL